MSKLAERRPPWDPKPGQLPARLLALLEDGQVHTLIELGEKLGVSHTQIVNAMLTARRRGVVKALFEMHGASKSVVALRLA